LFALPQAFHSIAIAIARASPQTRYDMWERPRGVIDFLIDDETRCNDF
jgi:hypothetical protein